MENNRQKIEEATLAGGCFWCLETAFNRLEGVLEVKSGYAGGHVKNPSYKEVCTGNTGHAEVVRILFDPDKISYQDLLEIFFFLHDPTTLNRQGGDIGTQYRSAIFYHDQKQKETAEGFIDSIEKEGVYDDPIVTEIAELKNFNPAEDYHLDYYNQNQEQPYCRMVISPKLDKFKKKYQDRLK
ncbi:MAG: peptide-methionine (S)-S-oxide reductase MsrA [Halanaerobiaceae bacterium]